MICFIKLGLFNILTIALLLSQSGLVLNALNWVPGSAEVFSIEEPILYNSFSSETLEISPEEMPLILPKLGDILIDQKVLFLLQRAEKYFLILKVQGACLLMSCNISKMIKRLMERSVAVFFIWKMVP